MSKFEDFNSIPFYLWIILAVILLAQGIWVFLDASRRGEKKYLWGFFALLNTPGNLLIYLLLTRIINKSKKCPDCKKYITYKAVFCPECGEKLKP